MDKLALSAFFDELEKISSEKSDRVMETVVKARPYAAGAFKAGVPAGFFGGILGGPKLARIFGITGAGLGAANEYLRQWARKHKRLKAAREILKQEKLGAMAGDLRRTGLGGVKRPPFPTEDSKRMAFNMLRNSKQPGLFTAKTEAKNLMKPGPSISQVSTV